MVMMIVWRTSVQQINGRDMAHFFVNIHLMYGVAVVVVGNLRMRSFAAALLASLRQDLADPELSPERVLEYRFTWTRLCRLSSGLIVCPVTMLLITGMLVLVIIVHSYESVERLTVGDLKLAVVIAYVGAPFAGMLFMICEIPHRTADEIREPFMNVLQQHLSPYRYKDDKSYRELHRFLEIVWWNSPVTAIRGYFDLRRSSFKTVVAVAVTYVIVILQFYLSLTSTEGDRNNGTLNTYA
ncbi:Gustatory and odorant receptor 63a [Frankliniella fusca]|uniref:Gustatory and odorant receptor 63a n=1 Tax=Frankliniella fusca TaxID=407009 RepID=A0AAE1LKE2_9NEOP|nr:Gustatory and odorant receptor 63a [Frankliniella fusca]